VHSTRFIPIAFAFALLAAACGSDTSAEGASNTAAADSSDAVAADSDETAADETATEATTADDGEEAAADCPATDGSEPQRQSFDAPPPMCLDPDRSYTAEVVTNQGTITIELDQESAPLTVNNFVTLARYKYFDGTVCHRIITGFVVQCGDPTATGTGNPGYRFPDELPAAGDYQLGSLAMANSGPDTNGSQFFIISGPSGVTLPPLYSLFGTVVDGYETTVVEIDRLGSSSGVPTTEVVIESVTITES
jgi:cyclophilin family peptidyl-prolyl cis-trans isomerase